MGRSKARGATRRGPELAACPLQPGRRARRSNAHARAVSVPRVRRARPVPGLLFTADTERCSGVAASRVPGDAQGWGTPPRSNAGHTHVMRAVRFTKGFGSSSQDETLRRCGCRVARRPPTRAAAPPSPADTATAVAPAPASSPTPPPAPPAGRRALSSAMGPHDASSGGRPAGGQGGGRRVRELGLELELVELRTTSMTCRLSKAIEQTCQGVAFKANSKAAQPRLGLTG